MAIEYDVVTWGIGGWRDDAFTAAVVFSTCAMLRYARRGSAGAAVALGAIAGTACLVRVTSLSFLLPGLVWALHECEGPVGGARKTRSADGLDRRADRGSGVFCDPALGESYGDPFLAIDIHTAVYRETEGESGITRRSVGGAGHVHLEISLTAVAIGRYCGPRADRIPFHEQVVSGFAPWQSKLGKLLSWSGGDRTVSICRFARRAGCCSLIVLATSLVPYMVTWKLIHDWRFTLHAYPFFLTAAAHAIATATRVVRPPWLKARVSGITPSTVAGWTAAALIVGTGVWIVQRILPGVVAKESLRHDEAVLVLAGARDAAFFVGGWGPPETAGNVTARVSELLGGRCGCRCRKCATTASRSASIRFRCRSMRTPKACRGCTWP